MRFLKALWLIIFFLFSLMFFIQNKEALDQKLALSFDTYYFNYVWTNTAVPFYFVVLVGFLAGAAVTLGYLLMDRVRLRMDLAASRRTVRKQEKELKKLRSIPLEATPLLEGGDSAEKADDGQNPA
ncbi:LapA family protein [Desulfovibrio sp. OttesenSCG-928-O18]|nr:LapA family protein [Desulfovibrio sp. OttesenSCG-928-O18]